MLTVLPRPHARAVSRLLVALATFVLFYLMTVFALSWGTTALGYSREKFLVMQLFGDSVLRAVHSDFRTARRTRPPPDADVGERGDRTVRL